ncbi:MAG: gliding motility-associated ABC transporter substrate-binding protein GldG [Bacteroidales bacterium]|nr:MAG: gliding motility-associated ABC transporter substrate-binding protein GldG [Bacteroidales bacterium]
MTIKSKKRKKKDILHLALLLAIILLINIISGFVNIRIDLTKENKYSLSAVSKEILKNLDDMVYITIYLDGKLSIPYAKFKRNIKDKLEEFKIYGRRNLEFRFIDPLKDKESEIQNKVLYELKQKGLDLINYTYKNNEGDLTIATIVPGALISYKGKEVPVNLLKDDPGLSDEEKLNNSFESLEYEFINMIRKISDDNPEKIAFVIGHGELYGYELEDILQELENGYQIDFLKISGQTGILDNYSSIIIAKPKYKFSEADKFVIDQYIMNGGKVLWLIDGVSVSMDSLIRGSTFAFINRLNIEDQLFRYGLRINPVLVRDKLCSILPINIAPQDQPPVWEPVDWLYFPLLSPSPAHPVTKNSSYIRSQFINTIDTLGARKSVKKTVLLKTSKRNKVVKVPAIINLSEINYSTSDIEFDTVARPVAVLLEGIFESNFKNRPVPDNLESGEKDIKFKDKSTDTKMIIIADGDIIRNDYQIWPDERVQILPLKTDKYIEFINNYYKKEVLPAFFDNKEFIVDAINYLTNKQGISDLRNREYKLRLLDREKTGNRKNRLKWQLINTLLPVFLIVILGVFYNYSRKTKYATTMKS